MSIDHGHKRDVRDHFITTMRAIIEKEENPNWIRYLISGKWVWCPHEDRPYRFKVYERHEYISIVRPYDRGIRYIGLSLTDKGNRVLIWAKVKGIYDRSNQPENKDAIIGKIEWIAQ